MAIRPVVATVLLAAVTLLGGCSLTSYVPNMDSGNAGCNNARGIGRAGTDATNMNAMPDLRGRGVAEAAAMARGRGHTVVFRVEGDGSCWCVTPPGGTVTDQWYGEHGALWLWVEGAAPSGDPGFLGHGC